MASASQLWRLQQPVLQFQLVVASLLVPSKDVRTTLAANTTSADVTGKYSSTVHVLFTTNNAFVAYSTCYANINIKSGIAENVSVTFNISMCTNRRTSAMEIM